MSTFQISTEIWDKIKASKFQVENGKVLFTVSGGKITTSKFLVRKLKLEMKDNEIRDMAEHIESKLADDTFKLVECLEPKDYTEMFKAGDSCMTVLGHGTWGAGYCNKAGKEILEKHGLWSGMWYHYNPHCRSFYLLKGVKPIARCFYLDTDALGSCYGSSHVDVLRSKVLELLATKAKGTTYVKITKDFIIPGVEASTGIYAPIPNCDNFIQQRHK